MCSFIAIKILCRGQKLGKFASLLLLFRFSLSFTLNVGNISRRHCFHPLTLYNWKQVMFLSHLLMNVSLSNFRHETRIKERGPKIFLLLSGKKGGKKLCFQRLLKRSVPNVERLLKDSLPVVVLLRWFIIHGRRNPCESIGFSFE